MTLLLYLPRTADMGEKLLPIVQAAVRGHKIEVCRAMDELVERLQKPIYEIGVAVLYATTRAELMEMVYLADFLGELRVVMVLPDGRPDMLEKAHILRPRFIAAAESDFKYLESILHKLMEIQTKTCRE